MAMSTAEDIYDIYATARTLSLPERLRLAAFLLDGLDLPPFPLSNPQDLPGYSDSWSEEDIRDFAAHSARYASSFSHREEALLPPMKELKALKAEQASV